jgi:RNA polymerase sigma-70 factor (ECF subfamily)
MCDTLGDMRNDENDSEWFQAWRAGDNHAGSLFFKRHAPAITRFFRNKLTSADDAADLLQETFLVLQRNRESGELDSPAKNARAYLFATARHILCAFLRKKYKRQNEALDFAAVCIRDLEPSSMSSIIMHRRELQVFVEALRAIPLDDQILLEYKYFDALSVKDIGELLGVLESVVPGRLQRAKGRLRQTVEQLSARMQGVAIPEPSDDELDRWAREIREHMGWRPPGSMGVADHRVCDHPVDRSLGEKQSS